MANPLGFVLPAASIGLGSLLLRPQRGFFMPNDNNNPVLTPLIQVPQATIEETHHDELEMTDHPVEQGASITDHAYKRPAEVVIRAAWSNSPSPTNSIARQAVGVAAAALGPAARIVAGTLASVGTVQSLLSGNAPNQMRRIYQNLLKLQIDRVLFDVYTGKRVYRNMLLRALTVTTDKTTENALFILAVCRQIIIVPVTAMVIPVNVKAQTAPAKTTPVADQGRKQLQSTDVIAKKYNPNTNIQGPTIQLQQ